jgi:Family of unknown function (DUF6519)
MGSDRARISYDERQRYRSVVMQQGRVTLEADWNESQTIAGEESRKDLLDIVGPAGTPDNGYAVTFPAPGFDFQVGPGTMYVGGMRSYLSKSVLYSQQSDWLDNVIDSDWAPVPDQAPGNEYVYLFLREQEVSAVEDSDLKDVALGGPDTAQRTRLIQHIVRAVTIGKDCSGALAGAESAWATQGLTFDPATMRLTSSSTMLVEFTDTGGAPTPCDPVAQGGYLGADNQLIRVQISSAGSQFDSGPGPRFLWGYDDASFLYRVNVVDPKTLKLQSTPIDAEHQPKAGQAVEVLMAAAQLGNGEFVAAPDGFVTTLAAAYNPDTQTISLDSPLPAVYGVVNPKDPQPERVYLRVWQQELPFTSGTPVPLGDTGVQVTLQTAKSAPFHLGDYWMFAVRPSTPQKVYPERYLTAAQSPDGPREWICPLAVIAWLPSGGGRVIADCRNSFDNLVDLTRKKLGGCCTANVSPADLTGKTTLQAILDQHRGSAGVIICFSPGVYRLSQPLILTAEHSNFTLEACAGGVVFQAAQGSESAFLHGMIVLNAAVSVSIRGIQFQLPLVPFGATTISTPGVPQAAEVFFSIGLRPAGCSQLTVADCQFEFAAAQAAQVSVGILAAGTCVSLRLERNSFEMQARFSAAGAPIAAGPTTFVAGFLLLPTTVSKDILLNSPVQPGATGRVLPSFLDRALVRSNVFTGITLPVFIYGDCGLAAFESNTVRNCLNGFWFLTLPSLALLQNLSQVSVTKSFAATGENLQNALFTILFHPAVQLATATLRGFPLPDNFDLSEAIPVVLPKPSSASKNISRLQDAMDRISSGFVKKTAKEATRQQVKIADMPATLVEHPISAPALETFNVAQLSQSYAQFENQAFLKPIVRAAPVSLHFADNDISTIMTGVSSGAGLLVFSLGKNDRDAAVVNGNTLVGTKSSGPISMIFGVSRCAHSGNMVLNEGAPTTVAGVPALASLWLFPLPVTSTVDGSSVMAAAVTGNVFRGVPILPLHTLTPAPLNSET